MHCCCADTTVNSSTDGTNAVSDASPDSGTNGVSDLISDDACPDSGPGDSWANICDCCSSSRLGLPRFGPSILGAFRVGSESLPLVGSESLQHSIGDVWGGARYLQSVHVIHGSASCANLSPAPPQPEEASKEEEEEEEGKRRGGGGGGVPRNNFCALGVQGSFSSFRAATSA